MLAAETSPFILLDDARAGGAPARLYRAPRRTIIAATPAELSAALGALRAARSEGLHAAGYLTYEAGAALHPRAPVLQGNGPILWFGLFDRFDEIAADAVPALLPDPAAAWAGAPRPTIDRQTYDARLAQVQALIAAGDIYQANLTWQASVPVLGDPLALYARLRAASHAGHGAIVATGERMFLSLSPELFFALDGERLTCRPMKGTAPRGDTPEEDRALATRLAADEKQRAENLMIVDLMRNDLSRVAAAGSVEVPALFAVETYPTVLQMTSTVTATLTANHDAVDVIEALFPCGSITGAPKSRAMEVIAEVEGTPRGLYTGSIGRIDANGDASFNVAIRTLAIEQGAATLGLGSGIVADSQRHEEWAECLAKGAFVTAGQRRIDLIETMAFDPEIGIARLERHLARMKASAERFGFSFDRHDARNELQAATFRLRHARRIRLVLAASGAVAIEVAPLPAAPAGPMTVRVMPRPVAPRDFRLYHKTSDRDFYDAARRDAGADEVLFVDEQGYLTEGSFTSLFVERDGVLVTPPRARGLLPGVLRAELLDQGRAVEGELTPTDLAGGFFLGNALRGLLPAIVAVAKESEL